MACTTLSYKKLSALPTQVDVYLDVYPPTSVPAPSASVDAVRSVPAVVYFHGGGLTVGNRRSWFPSWLHKRITFAGYAFISADYQLLPPSTGHNIVRDVQDLLSFVVSLEILDPSQGAFRFKIDPESIAVAGSSAGGLCAYLAAMHCTSPKPKAVLSMYGMGGNFLTAHYLVVKTTPFFRGREILDPHDFTEYLHDNHCPLGAAAASALQPIADSAPAYHPATYHIPGYPANPRMLLTRLYLQLGIFLDYYTGAHKDGGLSAVLRGALGFEDTGADDNVDKARALIPPEHHCLFPQFGVTDAWPPTLIIHGLQDTAVPIDESRYLGKMLRARGVDVEIREIEGQEHSFDYEAGTEELFGDVFDDVAVFLRTHIRSGVA